MYLQGIVEALEQRDDGALVYICQDYICITHTHSLSLSIYIYIYIYIYNKFIYSYLEGTVESLQQRDDGALAYIC